MLEKEEGKKKEKFLIYHASWIFLKKFSQFF